MNNLTQKSIRFPSKTIQIIETKVKKTLGIDINERLMIIALRI